MESKNSGQSGAAAREAPPRSTAWLWQDLERFFQALLDSSGHILFGLDREGLFVAVSAGWERLIGYAAGEMLGHTLEDFLQDSNHWKAFLQRLNEEDEATETFVFVHKKGHTVRCEVSVSPWYGENKRLLGYAVLGRDISAWEKFRDDLIRIDRLAEMGRMSAGVVHDLKNPLSIIKQAAGWAGVVVEDAKGLTEEDRNELGHTLKEIEEQTSRCRRITDQVLEFVRESKPQETDFDLKELIRETVRYLRSEINYSLIEVTCGFDDSVPVRVETDYQLLQQVLVNLLSNAIYAIQEKSEKKGRIDLGIESRENRVLISVADNGPGIPQEVRGNIFDLFYTTKPIGKGTGLGLPICRNIMQRLGGELSFESQIDAGTTFTVIIPKKKEH